jgi:hypothetical protein
MALALLPAFGHRAFADEPSEQSIEAASLIEAALINLRSIESFDVVISTSDLIEYKDGSLLELEMTERWIRDQDNNRSLLIRVGNKQLFEGEKENIAVKKDPIIRVALESEGTAKLREFPKRISSRRCPPGLVFEDMVGAPDFRLISVARFPAHTLPDEVLDPILGAATVPSKDHSMSANSQGLATVSLRSKSSEKSAVLTRWSFDTNHSIPTSVRSTRLWTDKQKSPSPIFVEQYEWSMINGIHVPRSISGERGDDFKRGPDGKQIPAVHSYDVTFKWRSVNKPLEEDLFDEKVLSDIGMARKLADFEHAEDRSEPLDTVQ